MSDSRKLDQSIDLLAPVWDPKSSDRCIVCSRPANGRAICSDARCAEELARG